MSKKLPLLLVFALLLAGGVFWLVRQKAVAPTVSIEEPSQSSQADNSQQNFVIDVDPDVSHWQTKETEHIVFKFPKEWYWIEATSPSAEYGRSSVITNNPDHELQYPDIGKFDDITNKTEVVITDTGTPTSNAGTPIDSLSSRIKSAKNFDPTIECVQPSDIKTLPLIASCVLKKKNHQIDHEYYVIDKTWTLTITARTSNNTLVSMDTVEKIARNIKIKY